MDKTYIMMNKPTGCITARRDVTHRTVMDYIPKDIAKDLFPIGRLDKDTEGLLLLTNDGQLNQLLMNPKHHIEKTYFFWALGSLNKDALHQIENGVFISAEEKTKPAKIEIVKSGDYEELKHEFTITRSNRLSFQPETQKVVCGRLTITEGKKHQVKRMLKAFGCYVVYLKRTAIGELQLDDSLKPGEFRPINENEIRILENAKL